MSKRGRGSFLYSVANVFQSCSESSDANLRHTRARSQPFRNNNNLVQMSTMPLGIKAGSSCLSTAPTTTTAVVHNLINSNSNNNNNNSNSNNSNLNNLSSNNNLHNCNNNSTNNNNNNNVQTNLASRTRSLAIYSKR